MPTATIERFWYFIQERYKIFVKKEDGKPKPWTDDKILQRYRFCNVHRENDKVTKWIAENWRDGNTDRYLWFAMAVARFINWPDSLEAVGYPVPWNSLDFKQDLKARKDAGLQVFTGAYIISARGSKIKYVADKILTPLWDAREDFAEAEPATLEQVSVWLRQFNGVGSFMAGQIIADMKYAKPYLSFPDWNTFAISGPGSRRGLNRIYGRPKRQRWSITKKGDEWKEYLDRLHAKISVKNHENTVPYIHAQDLQNCLCEFDKYERVRLGEGRPRSMYPGLQGGLYGE